MATDDTTDGDVRGLPPVHVVPIGSVRPAADNPRKITPRAVAATAKSIRAFGWKQPLVVDSTGTLIVGHTRHQAAQRLGLRTVPVIVADDLTEQEVRAYRITDNRTSDFTSWDFTALVPQLEDLSTDFADVLELADWQAIVASLDDLDGDKPAGGGMDVDDDLAAYVGGESHTITVVCSSEAAARRATAVLVELDGVLDVRDKR